MDISEQERAKLLQENKSTVRKALSKQRPKMRPDDYDELFADCWFAVSRAIDAFDPSRGVPIGAFIWRYIIQERNDSIRRMIGYQHEKADKTAIIFTDCLNIKGEDPEFVDERQGLEWIALKVDARRILEDATKRGIVSKRERQEIGMWLRGMNFQQIGDALGVTRSAVSYACLNAFERMRIAYDTK